MATDSPALTRPGLWPREVPRHTESEAEQKVYKALKTSLPGGWYAWHSLRLRTREKGEFSEADFIIADPNRPGIFILEVKGGQIEQRDGQWYQNSVQLKSSPLDQAFSFLKKLVRRFKENDVKAPTIGVAVCYPDTFFDQQPAQAFWNDRGVQEEMIQGFMKYALKKPYRCHPAIQHLVECYSGNCEPDRQVLRDGLKEEVIRIVTSSEGKLLKQIGKEINRLLSNGLKPGDIAVLSLRGRGPKEGITHKKEIGGHPIVLATDPKAGESIVCDTFLRFKGLERPAVIVTDLRLVSNLYAKRMHIAVSRALSLLRIVGVEGEIRKDRTLSGLI